MRAEAGERSRRGFGVRHRSVWGLTGIVLFLLAAQGCAHSDDEMASRPLPADPFPRWVGELETGLTTQSQVAERFGEPAYWEGHVRGGVLWRYVHPEAHWPEDDPLRPVVSAEGEVGPREPTFWQRMGQHWMAMIDWIDWAFYYPPRQPRPPPRRRLPATIHWLELHFGVDGTLQSYRYLPYEGWTWVTVPG